MTCTFPGCGRRHLSKGLCGAHYAQQARSSSLRPLQAVTRAERRQRRGTRGMPVVEALLADPERDRLPAPELAGALPPAA